ncbi:hypothetical protein [Photobacterium sanctipauli]|uniref:hypothetical protein n=1 Tax=Photobacterium sanctipauli TaxID=1342794 RepID=UPI000AAA5C48|nr:hypothetical protein [Photobacterium sanctipauli]
MIADMRFSSDGEQSTVDYQLVFNTPGTYKLYYRSSLFERGGSESYGGEDSFYASPGFGEQPDKKLGTRQSQDSELESHPITNPQEGKFFWFGSGQKFVVTEQDVGKALSFKVRDREKGIALDRFVFSLNHDLDVEEVGRDGDGNDLDQLSNSPIMGSTNTSNIFAMDYVPYYEDDTEIARRENELFAVYDSFLDEIQQANAAGDASAIIERFIEENNSQTGVKSSLRTLVTLVTEESFYPEWKNEVVKRFQEEGELARLEAIRVIEKHEGKINDLAQVNPIRHYMDYAWGLYMLGEFYSDAPQVFAFRREFENFVTTYIEGTAPYYDGPYFTGGYNKHVTAMDIASTITLLYKGTTQYPMVKEAFHAFWYNVTQMSYDGDNSPHYDAGTGFHIILNIALRHGKEDEVIASEHLLRMMDRMSRTVMSSGQSAKWGKSTEKSAQGQMRVSASNNLPWVLKVGYRLWDNPFYLYVARKYESLYLQSHGAITADDYKVDLWPLGIDAIDITLAKPRPEDVLSRATPRITSCCAQDGLLLGRGDTNYVEVQDKLIVSTGHHPRAPYLLMDLSYTQHKAAHDHRSGIDTHIFNGSHTVSRIKRWSEANKNNDIYINPLEYQYPNAPYQSKEVSAPGEREHFDEVMQYTPSHGYVIDEYGAGSIAPEAAYGFVDYSRYQYSGVGAKRQVALLHNGITVVSDTISAATTYAGGHNGGVLYQVLTEFKSDSGENWVLLRGQQKMLPQALPISEKETLDTLVLFASVPAGAEISLAANPHDPEGKNGNREWFSAHKPLVGGERGNFISLIIPLASTNNIERFVGGIEVDEQHPLSTIVRIPYTAQQQLQVTFYDQQPPSFEYVNTDE